MGVALDPSQTGDNTDPLTGDVISSGGDATAVPSTPTDITDYPSVGSNLQQGGVCTDTDPLTGALVCPGLSGGYPSGQAPQDLLNQPANSSPTTASKSGTSTWDQALGIASIGAALGLKVASSSAAAPAQNQIAAKNISQPNKSVFGASTIIWVVLAFLAVFFVLEMND